MGLLQRKEITGATLTGMNVTMGQAFRSFMNAGGKTTSSVAATPAPPVAAAPSTPTGNTSASTVNRWKLRELALFNSRITFADLGVGTTSVGFNLETYLEKYPVVAGLDRCR